MTKYLNNGYVNLINPVFTGQTLDHIILNAARVSYSSNTNKVHTEKEDEGLIRYLMRKQHTSPFEMIDFTFEIKLPIFIARQLIRHRTASINEVSGRYSQLSEDFYIPLAEDVLLQSTTNKQGGTEVADELTAKAFIANAEAAGQSSFSEYEVDLGHGISKELSRINLPLSTYTTLIFKMNLKNLLHFFDLRCDEHSQLEMRKLANIMLEQVTPLFKYVINAWNDYSPFRDGMLLTRYDVQFLVSSGLDNLNVHPTKREYEEFIVKCGRLGIKV